MLEHSSTSSSPTAGTCWAIAAHSPGPRRRCVLMLLLLLLKSVLCTFERGAAALEEADGDCAPANAEALWAGDVLIEES